MDVLRPFFEYTLRPEGPIYVAPLQPNMESVSRSSTLRLPPIPSLPGSGDNDNSSGPSARTFAACLPPTRDFLFAPLMHLLRSGISPVFRAIPGNWTASEVDVVRATLLLAYAARRVLLVHSLEDFVHSPAEVVFACYVEVWSGIHIEASREAVFPVLIFSPSDHLGSLSFTPSETALIYTAEANSETTEGQATFVTETRLYVTGYEQTGDGKLLGVKHCFNRPTASIWELVPLSENPDKATATACKSFKLETRGLYRIVYDPSDQEFPGLYTEYSLPDSPFLRFDDKTYIGTLA
ncbi:hypothetical protein L210DRAFT_3653253 [Boletus edulis BED1]|uniref:Uncharacterized protein n=1 Tax=Boletus edulis BED1 TaxID=1328754 RepID=A0AAD4BF65_BOLED|nr:hypothetical protein L210DRAFT_3653253 [Boletus edulis BED1]